MKLFPMVCLFLAPFITLIGKAGDGAETLDNRPPHEQIPPGFTIRHPKDGAEMVWVPAGYFRMGINADTAQKQAEQLGYKDYHVGFRTAWQPPADFDHQKYAIKK